MDRCGVGRHQRVEFAEAIGDGAAAETGGEFAVIRIDIVDVADVTVNGGNPAPDGRGEPPDGVGRGGRGT